MLNVSHELKRLDFYVNEYTGDIYFHTNSFAQRLVLPQGQKKTIHPCAAQGAFDFS